MLSLSSIADDAPGETLEVIWNAEVGASIIDDSGWEIVGLSAPDSAEMLAAQDAFAASQAAYEQSNKEHEAKVAEAARARAAWEAKVKACNAGDRAACAP